MLLKKSDPLKKKMEIELLYEQLLDMAIDGKIRIYNDLIDSLGRK